MKTTAKELKAGDKIRNPFELDHVAWTVDEVMDCPASASDRAALVIVVTDTATWKYKRWRVAPSREIEMA